MTGNQLSYAGATPTTAITGSPLLIFNLCAFGTNLLGDTFFIVGGIAQIFWALPVIQEMGQNMVYMELRVLGF